MSGRGWVLFILKKKKKIGEGKVNYLAECIDKWYNDMGVGYERNNIHMNFQFFTVKLGEAFVDIVYSVVLQILSKI